MVFRSFYGSSEPDTPSHNDSIPSNPLRPLSVGDLSVTEFGTLKWTLLTMQSVVAAPGVAPSLEDQLEQDQGRLFHVVLLDDDEHTYDYVIEMLQKLFCISVETAFQHAVEVDTTGRTVVITCQLPEAEFGRDQIQSYGADPRMPNSKGSMSALIEPAGSVATA